jgi:putative MATE family efflux protein
MIAKTELDMTSGSIPKKMLRFAIPLILSSWLQLSFNLADYIVCNYYVNELAVGAIGATGSLSSLIVDLFIGFAVGVNVVMGKAYGAKNKSQGEKTIGSSTLLAIVSGIFLAIIGCSMAKIFLGWMQTPSTMIDMSTTYMIIYFAGVPFLLLYNFGAACMRGMGDTIKPFIFLTIGGVINVCLNLLFVVPFQMGVAGLALATIISEFISALLVYISLFRNKGFARFSFKTCRFHKEETIEILRIGIPAGIQNAMFDIANVIIQSNINSFGEEVIAGDSAASRVNGYAYNGMDAFAQAGVAFIAANYGNKNKDYIKKSFKWAVIFSLIADVVLVGFEMIFRRQLLGLMVQNEEAIQTGELNIYITMGTHTLMALVDVLAACERGLGESFLPALVSFIGICVVRLVYIYTFFKLPEFHTMAYLYATYPISWLITAIAHAICCSFVFKKKFKELDIEAAKKNQTAIINPDKH